MKEEEEVKEQDAHIYRERKKKKRHKKKKKKKKMERRERPNNHQVCPTSRSKAVPTTVAWQSSVLHPAREHDVLPNKV